MNFAKFVKNLSFITFVASVIMLPMGVYFIIGNISKTISGLIITCLSALVLVASYLIAMYYHKKNIHTDKSYFIVGICILVVGLISQAVYFPWPADFVLIYTTILLVLITVLAGAIKNCNDTLKNLNKHSK